MIDGNAIFISPVENELGFRFCYKQYKVGFLAHTKICEKLPSFVRDLHMLNE